ncbi:hypothetical protein [Absidia glauca]|uniref:PWWP domain-containing protein n=1 Tax=Absidia glauca TaxID=4829 RepID=A0A168RA77_ABSGL|nr:hypothetical protein [Absidia glauca]
MGQQENNLYPPGTIVFAKLKGYPWWPAKVSVEIEDERTVPAKVMKQKTKSRSPVWTVFFFGSKDYGFFGTDSIRPFDKEEVAKDLKAKKFKTKDLERAVLEALDPNWVEQGDDDNDEGKSTLDKKRAKATDSRSARKSSAHKKTKVGKTAAATGEDDKDTLNHNKRGRKSMSQEHEEEGEGSNGHHRPSASPLAASRKSEDGLKDHESPEFTRDFKRLYHLRHRLQKLMYEKEQGAIPVDDYAKISQTLKEVEDAPMTYDLLRHTKIGKVVKCGIGYEFDNDTEFNIHERCQQLMRKWKEQFLDTKDLSKAQDDTTMHNNEPAEASTMKE